MVRSGQDGNAGMKKVSSQKSNFQMATAILTSPHLWSTVNFQSCSDFSQTIFSRFSLDWKYADTVRDYRRKKEKYKVQYLCVDLP